MALATDATILHHAVKASRAYSRGSRSATGGNAGSCYAPAQVWPNWEATPRMSSVMLIAPSGGNASQRFDPTCGPRSKAG